MFTIRNHYHSCWLASLLLVILLTILVYYPGLNGPFIFDDYPNILNNPFLWNNFQEAWDWEKIRIAAFSSGSGLLQRPVSMASFAVNILFLGQESYSFKAVNLAIHIVNGIIIFIFMHLLLRAYRQNWNVELSFIKTQGLILAVVSAWLVLPINLTAILYVVQRMTSLSALFLLLALISYVHYRMRLLKGHPVYARMLFSVFFLGSLSVLSKESGALLPVYMLVIEFFIFQFKNRSKQYDKILLMIYFGLLVIPCLAGLTWIVLNGSFSAYEGRLFNLPQRVMTEFRILILYMKWILLPIPQELSLYHDNIPISDSLFSPISTFLSLFAILAMLIFAFWQRNQRPLVALGIFWFFGGHLMESTIIPLELVFEHRNYLPSIGLFILIFSVLIFEISPKFSHLLNFFIVSIVLVYSSVTWLRANDWQHIVDLTAQEAYRNPDSPRVAYDLGKLYGNLVKDSQSEYVPLAYTALNHASTLADSSILPDIALIVLSYKINRPIEPEWYDRIETKLRLQPITFSDISALESLIKCAIMGGCLLDNDRIMHVFGAALESPNLDTRPAMKALLLSQYTNYLTNVLGYIEISKDITQQLIILSPSDLPYRINLIHLLIRLGEKENAIRELDKLQNLDRKELYKKEIESLKKKIAAL